MERGRSGLQMGFESGYCGVEGGLDLFGTHPDETNAVGLDEGLARLVSASEFFDLMDWAIDFDGKFKFRTVEIEDEPADRVLAAKFGTEETTIAQDAPEQLL